MAGEEQPSRAELMARLEEVKRHEEELRIARQFMADMKAGKNPDLKQFCRAMGVDPRDYYLDEDEEVDDL